MTKDDSWVDRLWAWADENNVSELKLPRTKEKLTLLTMLDLSDNHLEKLPSEIVNT